MENKKYYTKIYKDGTKHIFQYKGEANEKGYADTYMSCSNDQPDYFDNSNGSRNIIYIGNEGTSEGSTIIEATEEDIQFLHFIRDNWKYDEGKGYLALPYEVEEKIWSEHKIPEVKLFVDLLHIEKLINEFKKEELPNAKEPFHYEAEIAAGLESFVRWLKTKNNVRIK